MAAASRAAAKRGRQKSKKLLTRRELAQTMGVHMQTVTKWEQDGMPVAQGGRRGVPSLYDPTAVEAWHAARLLAQETSNLLSLEAERARKERAQAQVLEQTYLMRGRELLPRTEVEKIWSQHIAAVRTKLLALPITLADRIHRVAQLDGVASVEQALAEAVRDVLRELAEGDE